MVFIIMRHDKIHALYVIPKSFCYLLFIVLLVGLLLRNKLLLFVILRIETIFME